MLAVDYNHDNKLLKTVDIINNFENKVVFLKRLEVSRHDFP